MEETKTMSQLTTATYGFHAERQRSSARSGTQYSFLAENSLHSRFMTMPPYSVCSGKGCGAAAAAGPSMHT